MKLSKGKRWGFRLAAAVLAPLLFFILIEMGLRLAGFGYSTSFLLPSRVNGQDVLVQNNRFGWRFFSPNLARQPTPFAIARVKPPETVRIFVFGESAAYGDPQPEFGIARLLQTLLRQRYPGVPFEVVNAAMTGINSHAVLPIARDCVRARGDIWVVYMGNNEVVGPYGAGTVFGPQAPRLALIRGRLALKATRLGQLLDAGLRKLNPPPADKSEWGGMLMFLGNQVRSDDARMDTIYRHFERNLGDILQAGRTAGVGMVVGTVAVNLKDSAPFASQQRPGLADTAKERWHDLFLRGLEAQKSNRHDEALQLLRQAEQTDDSVADLQFVMARSFLATGQEAEASRRFARARDLDVLRFRCDSRLNSITRRLASGREQDRIHLADAEETLARLSPGGLPGNEFFYEHVHLTFEGNYALALTIAEQVEKVLPEPVRHQSGANQAWASLDECAHRLAWTDWQRLGGVIQMFGRLGDPPFTGQLDHLDQVRRLNLQIEQLRRGTSAAIEKTETLCREALAAAPNDAVLLAQQAGLRGLMGDAKGASASAHRAVDLLPNSVDNWMLLGKALGQQQRYEDAVGAYRQALQQDPDNCWARRELARAYTRLGRREDAMREYKNVIRIKPRFGMAHLELGRLIEEQGRKDEAESHYRLALKNRVYQASELTALAQFCRSRGWLNEAITNYLDAIKLSPSEPMLHIYLGQCLVDTGRKTEALQQYAEAVRLSPDLMQARYLLGLEFGRQGKSAEAAEQFREAVRLMPDLVEARLNLAIALAAQGHRTEALGEFREVLRRSPTNAIALRQIGLLQAAAPATTDIPLPQEQKAPPKQPQ